MVAKVLMVVARVFWVVAMWLSNNNNVFLKVKVCL